MSAAIPTSVELWAAAKVIGRECSAINKEFFICKKEKGANPDACAAQAALSSTCANKVVNILREEFPVEFKNFQTCLDKNDFRYNDCRNTEKAFLERWNAKNGATA